MSFSILIPTCGRASLTRTLASIVPQLAGGDEVVIDRNDEGDFGNAARNRMMKKATGDYLLFIDSDDSYTDDAFQMVREAVAQQPHRVHMFKMRYADGRTLWSVPEVRFANVSTQMVVVPNIASLGQWSERYEADFDFISETCANLGEPIWHDHVIALIDQ